MNAHVVPRRKFTSRNQVKDAVDAEQRARVEARQQAMAYARAQVRARANKKVAQQAAKRSSFIAENEQEQQQQQQQQPQEAAELHDSFAELSFVANTPPQPTANSRRPRSSKYRLAAAQAAATAAAATATAAPANEGTGSSPKTHFEKELDNAVASMGGLAATPPATPPARIPRAQPSAHVGIGAGPKWEMSVKHSELKMGEQIGQGETSDA